MTQTLQSIPKSYAAISAESNRTGMPVHYTTDVTTHDFNFCIEFPDAQFVWVLRESGSWIFYGIGKPENETLKALASLASDPEKFIYRWNGRTLAPLDRTDHSLRSALSECDRYNVTNSVGPVDGAGMR